MLERNVSTEQRRGPRYVVQLPVQAEWTDTESGKHFVTEGETANVGHDGTLVHLRRELPGVGNRVHLIVQDEHGTRVSVVAEVLRLERNAAQPLAVLQLLDATDEWRGLVWEPAAPRYAEPAKNDEESDDDNNAVEH